MSAGPSVDILLGTYNGAAYLQEQLESLMGQTCADWRLLVRDDGSTDGTSGILQWWQEHHPGRFRIIPPSGANVGPRGNFALLLAEATAPYAMFCDQDDVWMPEKIERSLARMKTLEAACGAELPLLVHTDLAVVDERLREVAPSLWRYQGTDPVRGSRLNRLLLQNCATGCSMLMNRPLYRLAQPIPPEAVMHDWWVALVASVFGRTGFCPETTVLYRQHGANDTGAKRLGLSQLFGEAGRLAERRRVLALLQRQAGSFLRQYGERLPAGGGELLERFAVLGTTGWFMRRYYTVKYGFWYASTLRNLGRMFLV